MNPIVIKPGDEVVLMLNDGTCTNLGKLTGLSAETVTPPPIRERVPKTSEEYQQSLRGIRFFERDPGAVITVFEFTFEKDIAYVPIEDTSTPDCSSD